MQCLLVSLYYIYFFSVDGLKLKGHFFFLSFFGNFLFTSRQWWKKKMESKETVKDEDCYD